MCICRRKPRIEFYVFKVRHPRYGLLLNSCVFHSMPFYFCSVKISSTNRMRIEQWWNQHWIRRYFQTLVKFSGTWISIKYWNFANGRQRCLRKWHIFQDNLLTGRWEFTQNGFIGRSWTRKGFKISWGFIRLQSLDCNCWSLIGGLRRFPFKIHSNKAYFGS